MAWNQPGKGNQDPWKPRSGGNPVEDFLNRLKDQLGGGNQKGGGHSSGFGPLEAGFTLHLRHLQQINCVVRLTFMLQRYW